MPESVKTLKSGFCCYHRYPDPRAQTRCHEQSHPAYFTQSCVTGHQRAYQLIITVNMSPAVETGFVKEGTHLKSNCGAFEILV